jgi:hypothetical protein
VKLKCLATQIKINNTHLNQTPKKMNLSLKALIGEKSIKFLQMQNNPIMQYQIKQKPIRKKHKNRKTQIELPSNHQIS